MLVLSTRLSVALYGKCLTYVFPGVQKCTPPVSLLSKLHLPDRQLEGIPSDFLSSPQRVLENVAKVRELGNRSSVP